MSSPVVQQGTATLNINSDRLIGRIEELAWIGREAGGGITRAGFSAADREARAYLMDQARDAGLSPSVDAAGNILIRRHPPTPAAADRKVLLIGSHLDTVVNAGRLDGAYGVLAALEVLQVVDESGIDLRDEPVAVAFANEEGALFPQPFWGSKVLAGRLADLPLEPLVHQGQALRDQLSLAGGDLGALGSAVWPSESLAAYLELHVEQGPVLERSGRRIGIVDVITGRTVLTAEVRGAAGHAGTTPMDHRRDAVAVAARVTLAAESIARDQGICRVSTVGRWDIHPNSANTIADSVRLTVDLRDSDAVRMRQAEAAFAGAVREIAAQTGTSIDIVAATRSQPVPASVELRAAIERSADELGLPYQVLPSGAGHDAQVVADIAPIAMIFVPSIGGISHVPEEDTDPEDLLAGAQVLLRTALRVSGTEPTVPAGLNSAVRGRASR
jgi:N-carbamoyl-L-amino-acid hydrolase